MDFSLFSSLQGRLSTAKSVYIFLPKKARYDQVAAGLGLYLALSKAGKSVYILSPDPVTVEFSSLVGVDKIGEKLRGRNLVISFDYVEDSIEKVSYNIENGKFNLVIQTKEGFPSLSSNNVNYSYTGGLQGLIITMEVADIAQLGPLYFNNKDLFSKAEIFDLNRQDGASLSEIVAGFISYAKLPIDQDIATNLLLGIDQATDSFSEPAVNADTFEAAAFCLRAGGQRKPANFVAEGKTKIKSTGKVTPSTTPTVVADDKNNRDEAAEKPSPDWLQPKIYKGNTRI